MMYCNCSVCDQCDLKRYKKLSNDEMLQLDVDVLVLAALENQIHKENGDAVKAKLILEIANGPVTSEADAILDRKGIFVLPDVLVNAGGVTVSHFEWVQNRAGLYWEEETVNDRLKEKMSKESNAIFDIAEEKKISLRTAAYLQGVKRIAGAIGEQGTREYFQNE